MSIDSRSKSLAGSPGFAPVEVVGKTRRFFCEVWNLLCDELPSELERQIDVVRFSFVAGPNLTYEAMFTVVWTYPGTDFRDEVASVLCDRSEWFSSSPTANPKKVARRILDAIRAQMASTAKKQSGQIEWAKRIISA